jgi:uncharacterized protein (TIGR02099 family)
LQQETNNTQTQLFKEHAFLHRIGVVFFWVLLAVYVPLSLALLAMRWLVLPDIDHYRPQIQKFLQVQTGVPIQIGALNANWHRLGPEFNLNDVMVRQPNGEVGFSAKSIRLDWTLSGILTFRPRLKNLEVDSLTLHLLRNQQGALEIAGIPVVHDHAENNPMLGWLLKQQRVLIKNGVFNWQDNLGQLPEMQAVNTELLIKNSLGRHQAGLSFELPTITESPVKASLNFSTPLLSAQLGKFTSWSGTAYLFAQFEQTKLFDSTFKALGLNVSMIQPEGKLWIDFERGELKRSMLDAKIAKFTIENKNLSALPFEMTGASALVEVFGLHAPLKPDAVFIRQLKGQVTGQKQFGPTDLSIEKNTLEHGVAWKAQVQKLDAAQAKLIALALGPHLQEASWLESLKAYDIAGQIKRIDLAWVTSGNQPVANSVAFTSDLEFQDLTVLYQDPKLAVNAKATGFKQLSGTLKGNESSGQWTLSGKNSEVALPEIFPADRFKFDSIRGRGGWKNAFDTSLPVEFSIEQLNVHNQDLQAELVGTYEFRHHDSDVINLKGSIASANIAKVSNYLPWVAGKDTRQWLGDHLKAGLAKNGEFELSGQLNHFPFDEAPNQGVFRIEVPFEQGELTYASGWPSIQNINGKAIFNRKSMQIQVDQAETLGVRLNHVQAQIDNLDAHDPMLNVTGQALGELGAMVNFVNLSPLRQILNEALVNTQADGNALLDLKLLIPVTKTANTQVQGDLHLKGNGVRVVRGMPNVSNLEGLIKFSNQGILIKQLQGQALGGPVTISGSTDTAGRVEIRATGTARAKGLVQFLNPVLEPYFVGSTPYNVVVGIQDNSFVLDVNSQLQGLELMFPSPLGKKADARLSFKLSQVQTGHSDRWQIDLGPDGKPMTQLRATVSYPEGSPVIDSLQFAVGAPLAAPTAGIQGDVRVPVIDLDDWRAIVSNFTSSSSNSGLVSKLIAGPSERRYATNLKVSIRADRLNVGSKSFEGVSVAARTVEKRWQFDLKAKGVDGYLSWISDQQRPDGAVLARFKTLVIPKTLDRGFRELVEEPASSIPALDVQVDNFTLNDLSLGSLKLTAVNQTRDEQVRAAMDQLPREWMLEELKIENPESVTLAKGVWQYGNNLATQRTDIEVIQTVKNAGDLLTRLGMAGVFRGGQATLVGKLRWNDAPTNIDYDSLSGQFKLTSSKGQFLKADPGVAKLLGVLSLQSIPRRFTLDFKDVFSEGFVYDTMEADVSLKEGIAVTQNFKMIGPNATVLMDGDLDLESETQNLNLVVLPDVNPAGGSLIYSLIAANPAVGIASLIADFVLKDPLAKVFSFQYRVSGPWTAPVIERVRKGDTAPSTPPPAN